LKTPFVPITSDQYPPESPETPLLSAGQLSPAAPGHGRYETVAGSSVGLHESKRASGAGIAKTGE